MVGNNLWCSSPRRVTSKLLLSFLALSPTSSSSLVSASSPVVRDSLSENHPSWRESYPGRQDRNQIPLDVETLPDYPNDDHDSLPFDRPSRNGEHVFTLRQVFHHGAYQYPHLHRRQDVHPHVQEQVFLSAEDGFDRQVLPPLRASSTYTPIQRLADRRPEIVDARVADTRRFGYQQMATINDIQAWTIDDVLAPNISDKQTVLSLAYMAADAYVEREDLPDWIDVGAPYNRTEDFGWESDGLRGHIFADETNSTVVVGLKGTSLAVFDGEGTTTNDKVNDNLFFSCCCAQQGQWTWHKVCECATGTYMCNTTCVRQELLEEHRYYTAARELYSNVTELYPNAQIWLAGHSLGGAVSSLLGLTYGIPVVTFQAVPEALPAKRLGLPLPPGADAEHPQMRSFTGIYHFGHTADPIYIGSCNGATATCSYAGYAMESVCHAGHECVYDVVADKGWRVGIGTHRIRSIIRDVLLVYDDVPPCVMVPQCRDCIPWTMYESNGTEPSSSSSLVTSTTSRTEPTSITFTRTRTETCKTPGWWGCLDEPSTGTDSTTPTTSSTSTCQTPGWFGCKDKTTSESVTRTEEIPITETSSSEPTTTTCETPGWFGCLDSVKKTDDPETEPFTSDTLTSTTCETPGWFFGCRDATTSTSTTSNSIPASTSCQTPGRFWGCYDEDLSPTASEASLHPAKVDILPTADTVDENGPMRDEF